MDKALKKFRKCAEDILSGKDYKWPESENLKNSVCDFTSFIFDGEEDFAKQDTAETAKNLDVVEYDDNDAQEVSSFNASSVSTPVNFKENILEYQRKVTLRKKELAEVGKID